MGVVCVNMKTALLINNTLVSNVCFRFIVAHICRCYCSCKKKNQKKSNIELSLNSLIRKAMRLCESNKIMINPTGLCRIVFHRELLVYASSNETKLDFCNNLMNHVFACRDTLWSRLRPECRHSTFQTGNQQMSSGDTGRKARYIL